MTTLQVLSLCIQISLALIVFCVALRAAPNDITSLLRRPSLLVRSLLAMNVVTPTIVVGLVFLFDFRHDVAIALIALSLSPIPPIVPVRQIKASNEASYVVGLLVIVGLVSIAFVPAAVVALGWLFGHELSVPVGTIASIIGTSVLLPIVAGMCVRAIVPSIAERIAARLSFASMVLLLACLVPLVISVWPAMLSLVGNFTLLGIAAFVLSGLAAGHLLGGPDPGNRTVLALSAATRHPSVAFAIIKANAQAGVTDTHSVFAALILYLLFGALISLPYVKWRTGLLRADSGSGANVADPASIERKTSP